MFALWLAGFIAVTDEGFYAVVEHPEAELLCAVGADVKECEILADERERVSVMNCVKVNACIEIASLIWQEQFVHQFINQWDDSVVRVYIDVAGEGFLVHELGSYPDNPDYAEQVVNVRVSDEHVVNVLQSKARMFQAVKDGVTSAGIDEQAVIVVCEDVAGVVAFSYESIACTEHGDVHDVIVARGH